MQNCVVLVPVSTTVEPGTQACLEALNKRGYHVQYLIGCSQVDQARNELATWAYDEGFAETLWVDSDVTFSVDDVEKLRSHNLPLCAGLYPKKGPRDFAVKFKTPGTYQFGVGGRLHEVEYCGMGFVHVRRQVYEAFESKLKMPRCGGSHSGKPAVPYFIPSIAALEDGSGFIYLADDSAFCHRARDCGFTVMVDTTIKLGHIGRRAWTWDDFFEVNYPETLDYLVKPARSI